MDKIPANELSAPSQTFDELDQLAGGYYSATGTEAFPTASVTEASAETESSDPEIEQYVLSMRQRFLNGLREGAFAVRTYLQGIELSDIRRAGGATLGAAVAITALAACTEAAPTHETKSPSPTPTPEATTNPSDKLVTGEALTAEFEIPSGMSDQDLAKAFVDKWSAWNAYGSVKEVGDKAFSLLDNDGDVYGYLDSVVADNNNTIADALFVPNWESIPTLSVAGDGTNAGMAGFELTDTQRILVDWVKTFKPTPANQEAYKVWYSIDSTVPVSSEKTTTGRVLTFILITNTNASENLVSSNLATPQDAVNGKKTKVVVSFQTVGSNDKVANISLTPES